MKTYKEIEDGVIEWREVNGESTTIGLIIEGQTRTRKVQTGMTEQGLDEVGNLIAEVQPIFESEVYSPWDELLDSGATIEWISDEDKAAQARQERIERAKVIRDEAIDENIEVFDVMWQVDKTSRDRLRETINVASDTNQPVEATVPWRLGDNTYRDSTAADLKMVLAARANRMALIFQAFSAWEESGSTEEFSV